MASVNLYKTPFMQLEMKRVDSLNLEKPLKKFLEKQYGMQVAGKYEDAITNIQQKRTEMKNLQERSEGSKMQCLKYAADLIHVNRHFPINSGSQRINLTFGWYDSFSKRKVSQGNLYYELANTVFVAAVLACQLGCAESRSTAQSFMTAAKQFQHAASLFLFIKENVCPQIVERITLDITSESLDCLANLMLAYAQQCIVERALFSKMKPENVSKLSFELSCQYATVFEQMKSETLSSNFDRNWLGAIEFKGYFYKALSHYVLSKKHNSEDEKGIELSRLYVSIELLDSAKGCRISTDIKTVLSDLRSDVKTAIKAGERENAKVYHERVPAPADLPKIGRTKLVKTTEIKSLIEEVNSEDPFSSLFPVHVMEAQDMLKEELTRKLNDTFRTAREHRENVKRKLAQLGLPGSILANETNPGFPEAIHQSISKINQQGGYDRLVNLRQTLGEMAQESRSQCHMISDLLKQEEQEDIQCRNQYQNRWTRKPSAQLTVNFKSQVNDFTKKVDLAGNSDNLVDQKLREHEAEFRRFELPRQALDNLMPRPSNQNQSQVGIVSELQNSLSQLDSLLGKEGELEKYLSQKCSQNEEKEKKYLLENEENLKQAVQSLLSNYDNDLDAFKTIGIQEDELMSKISIQNEEFMKKKTSNDITKQRELALQRMYSALDRHEEILANLKEGIQFYSSMQEFLKQLKERVESFVFARRIEKKDMLLYIQQTSGGTNPYGSNQPNNPFQQGRGNNQNGNQHQYQYNYPDHYTRQ